MTEKNVSSQSSANPSSASPPDLNHGTYPYDLVQRILDETASLSMFALPEPRHPSVVSLTPDTPEDWYGLNGGYGLALSSHLHRFESVARAAGPPAAFAVDQSIGEATGTMTSRWLFCPEDSKWSPDTLPNPWLFDPWRSQQFVMAECEFNFGDKDTCRSYGMGRTFPISVEGKPVLLAGAVGNIIGGTGAFAGREGTLVCCGTITPNLGFSGNVNLRVRDDQGTIVTRDEITPLTSVCAPENGHTFLELQLAKKDSNVLTTFGPPPGNGLVSLMTPSEMRSVQYSYQQGKTGLRTRAAAGQVLGPMQATVFFDLFGPPATADSPATPTTQETYVFASPSGDTLGTVSCGVTLGYSFALQFPSAPGQLAMRFGGVGPIRDGTGIFQGAQGMLAVNSLIAISPHALSLMHVLYLVDGRARFPGRTASGRG
jgi:hypothetical protein